MDRCLIDIMTLTVIQQDKNNNRRRDNGNGPDNSYSQQPAQASSYNQGPPGQAPAPAANPAGGAVDPYAVYGGYQNYIAMWYASIAQQQQGGQPGQGPPGA